MIINDVNINPYNVRLGQLWKSLETQEEFTVIKIEKSHVAGYVAAVKYKEKPSKYISLLKFNKFIKVKS